MPKLFLAVGLLAVTSLVGAAQPTATPTPTTIRKDTLTPINEIRLTRVASIAETTKKQLYFELKEEGFRIQLPGGFSNYVPSRPASVSQPAVDGQITWNVSEAEIVIMFADMDESSFAKFSPSQRSAVLTGSLASILNKPSTIKIEERDVTVNGIPGKEVRYTRGQHQYLARTLFLGARLFVFVASLKAAENAESLVKRSWDSFESIKSDAPEPKH